MGTVAMHTATTGLEALSTSIDVIANNLANVNTVGFKRSRANFEDLLYHAKDIVGASSNQDVWPPAGTYVGLGTQISNTQTLWTQGSPIDTESATDMSIQGDGLFRVKIFDDVGGGFGFTRAGNFIRNADGDLVLADSDGYRLDPPVNVPPGATDVAIQADGTVLARMPDEDVPTKVGQVTLFRFANNSGLEAIGKNLYIPTEASGDSIQTIPGAEGAGFILSTFLESSNVTAVRELVNLIKAQRAFELNSQVITSNNEMLQNIVRLAAR